MEKKRKPPSTAYSVEEGRSLNPTNNPWRNEKNVWYTQGLFYEFAANDKTNAIYTIYEKDVERDGKIYKSLKDAYVNFDHVPGYEYEFSKKYFGGWEHWGKLISSSQNVKELIQSWRDELEIKIKSHALKGIIKSSFDETPTGFQAQKWLSDKGWVPSKGRPKKADIQREAKIEAGVQREIEEDLQRLKLVK